MEDELFNACQPLLSSPPSKPALLPQLLAAISGGLIAPVALPSSLIPQLVEEGMAKDLATAYLYSAVPACLFGGLLSAWLGRRKMVLLALGYIALPLSPSFAWLVPARVFTALCAWLAYPSANVLVTEFVHPTVRGSLESFTSLFLLLLPESPQWLALQGRQEEASASLSWARGTEFLNVADKKNLQSHCSRSRLAPW